MQTYCLLRDLILNLTKDIPSEKVIKVYRKELDMLRAKTAPASVNQQILEKKVLTEIDRVLKRQLSREKIAFGSSLL